MKNTATCFVICMVGLLTFPIASFAQKTRPTDAQRTLIHNETPDQSYAGPREDAATAPAMRQEGTGFFTVQVNVNSTGENILGDAANEPSIAVDPVNPERMVIGWRQFDDVNNNFRQAGYAYSSDAGQSWTFPGKIEPFIFRSDPVLDFDADGNFYYNSLTSSAGQYICKVFKSADGGATWDAGVDAKGGDKQWMAIDVTDGPGAGNIYSCWNASYSSCLPGFFTRSTDAGASFNDCETVDGFPYWGTMAVGPTGELIVGGAGSFDGALIAKSTNAQIAGSALTWNYLSQVDLDGYVVGSDPINPVGILGQVNVDVDRSNGPGRGNIYVLASVARLSGIDPADVMFARSTDGGASFDPPKRLNNDVSASNYQWFGTLSVAPNGRIDVIWLDTRENPGTFLSSLYYCYSDDQGVTWSINKKLSDAFDPTVGYPQQEKIGDYYDMVSDNTGAHLAWANTLNEEQDVYYTHIIPTIVGLDEEHEKAVDISVSCSPNPFTEKVSITYEIPSGSHVGIEICDISGSVVYRVPERWQTAGIYTETIQGELLPAGFYICRVSTGNLTTSRRLIKLK
jgi:hypothetical protein